MHSWGFPGCLVFRIQCFHSCGLRSIPGQGTEILPALGQKKRKKKEKEMHSSLSCTLVIGHCGDPQVSVKFSFPGKQSVSGSWRGRTTMDGIYINIYAVAFEFMCTLPWWGRAGGAGGLLNLCVWNALSNETHKEDSSIEFWLKSPIFRCSACWMVS